MRRCLIDGQIVLRASSIRSSDKCDKVSLVKKLSDSRRLKCPYCKNDVIFKYSFNGLFKTHFAHLNRKGSLDCPYLSEEVGSSDFSYSNRCQYFKPKLSSKPRVDNLVISDSSCVCGSFEFLDTDLGILCLKCFALK